ncbi:MAG TPA: 50S ribosomal protein L32 [Chloroflexia bacterium]|nr:50S ribosomal protein L32 [Chloroflexia bacterium]
MGALPKQRISRAQQGKRRTSQILKAIHIVECPNCHNLHRSHYVCPSCGTYKGLQVYEIKQAQDES